MHELERKLCLVGLWCIQMKSHDRPTMSEAIEMLEGGVDALQVPPRPFFYDGDGMPPPQVMDSYFHSSELTAISEEDDGILCELVVAAAAMVIPGSFCCPIALQVFISLLCALAVLVPDADGRRHHRPACPPFTCGHLSEVSPPFRRLGDPPECGVASYELSCTNDKAATIQIDNGTYLVTDINYKDSTLWVVDANISDSRNNCPLPRWNRDFGYYDQMLYKRHGEDSRRRSIQAELMPPYRSTRATFVTCSQEMRNNGKYRPVACMSTNSSFVYVLTGMNSNLIGSLEPSCGYLAMTPLDAGDRPLGLENASYIDVVKLMRGGFAIRFPYTSYFYIYSSKIKQCIAQSFQNIVQEEQPTYFRIFYTVIFDYRFWGCLLPHPVVQLIVGVIPLAMWTLKFILAPLVILTFLARKFWKIRIKTDAVEKFLRMQLVIGPTRYAYTDLIAITGHFGEKLGQGGYGSVYKGVVLPGNAHVAVKVLGNSNCNGEEFISEVSTIGRIHHINVVHLVGFCSEEIRRALVYEYMPRGSLDKYIFSSERSFSWDKLNEIALGIARGINYLHQGYIAPEMISRSFGIISSKSDVYSFGMLLLEMAGGRRNSDMYAENSNQTYFPSWVYDQLTEQQVGVGEIPAGTVANMHELERKLCIIGLHCIQMKSHDRPTMSEVIEMLEGGVVGLQMPPRPFFCDDEPVSLAVNSHQFSSELTVCPQILNGGAADGSDLSNLYQARRHIYHLLSVHHNTSAFRILDRGEPPAWSPLVDMGWVRKCSTNITVFSEDYYWTGRHHKCPSFSCGHLKGVSAPFRRAADPPRCGSKSYELVYSDTNATILIDNATYHVNEINYDYRRFWVVDANIAGSTCPLPRWNHLLDQYKRKVSGHRIEFELVPAAYNHANFVRCSREVEDNGIYRPVTCASSNYSFIYVLLSSDSDNPGYIESLEPSCGYLAMTPLGDWSTTVPRNASYEDVKKFMREGFAIRFPRIYGAGSINECLMDSISKLRNGIEPRSSTGTAISDRLIVISIIDLHFWSCLIGDPSGFLIAFGMWIVKCIAVLCRFVLVPLAILTFLAHKYWKTRLAIDAVEKFLQMQQVLGPTRYAYTDLTTVTSHFRDKLGQGGYGSVYKGVLLSGDVHVAVKMLNGASTYDGEEFISEVSTIGRIHHVNVVRLVGFCSEELRRALVYEYMPQGSLDKYIFSSERSFSWDKLNEIAIGIARGINYLH
uniref:Protein kinase domain-containing protein n=1 Tax=Oryza glumipatula TaxID=40148 RepID=A0A0D9Y2E1_9ORYZ